MRNSTLKFLRAEKEALTQDADLLRSGMQTLVCASNGTPHDVTATYLSRLDQRLNRFEEIIAAIEAKIE